MPFAGNSNNWCATEQQSPTRTLRQRARAGFHSLVSTQSVAVRAQLSFFTLPKDSPLAPHCAAAVVRYCELPLPDIFNCRWSFRSTPVIRGVELCNTSPATVVEAAQLTPRKPEDKKDESKYIPVSPGSAGVGKKRDTTELMLILLLMPISAMRLTKPSSKQDSTVVVEVRAPCA